jgi:hypothetical protein
VHCRNNANSPSDASAYLFQYREAGVDRRDCQDLLGTARKPYKTQFCGLRATVSSWQRRRVPPLGVPADLLIPCESAEEMTAAGAKRGMDYVRD